jgi:hypothetical protein
MPVQCVLILNAILL